MRLPHFKKGVGLFPIGLLLSIVSVAYGETYYVSKGGNDDGEGSRQAPFLTLSKAASVMVSGDECQIAAGLYRESIRPAADGVTFRAMLDQKVVVSGFDRVTDWAPHSGSIYVADIDWELGDENQVFYGGEMMTLSRWPNKTNSDLFDLEMVKTTGTNSSVSHPDIPDQNWANGGVILFLGKSRWTSWRVPLTGSQAGRVDFAELSTNWDYSGSHSPTQGGEFFLMNTLEALDAEGEWYIDRAAMKVYFWAPGGVDPSGQGVEVRRRPILADFSGRENVKVSQIEFFGGGVDLKDAEGCVVRSCRIHYGNHTMAAGSAATVPEASVAMNEDSLGNTVYRNEILWGAANGVVVKGVGNIVDNNIIGNFDYLGCYACPVEMRGTNYITRNEIFNAGRDCVRGGGTNLEFAYNDVHHANLINDDCGGIYLCCGTYTGTRIHHNWIHDISSRNNNYESYKATGVYLDNSTVGVTVDHNVFWNLEWSCIQINWQGENLEIHNNTFWTNDGPDSAAMKRWVNGYEFINVNLYNTLANDDEFHANEVSNSCVLGLNDDPFEDFANRNFVPKEGSCAIDAGMVVPGITGEYVGSAPDVGAYERGGPVWTPGPRWESGDSLFDEDKPELGFVYDGEQDEVSLVGSNLTAGRGHSLRAIGGDGEWRTLDVFVPSEGEEYLYSDASLDEYSVFQLAEKIAIPLDVNFVSAALQKDGLTIKLRFDLEIVDPSGELANFTLKAGETPLALQSVVQDEEDATLVELSLVSAAPEGTVFTLSYSPGIRGVSGGEVLAFVNEIVDTSISDANLVEGTNGDGEKGDNTGWTFGENDALGAKVSVVDVPVHGGQYAIQAIYDATAPAGVSNLRHAGGAFTALAGASYELSIWHYGKDLADGDTYTTELSVYDAASEEVLLDHRTWKGGTPNQWNQTTSQITFTPELAGDYVLGFRIYGGHYTLIVDDVSVMRLE